jgi:hypothetical protein
MYIQIRSTYGSSVDMSRKYSVTAANSIPSPKLNSVWIRKIGMTHRMFHVKVLCTVR